MSWIILVGLVLFPAFALVPVEGLLLGEANTSLQSDPLAYVFREPIAETKNPEVTKLKLYGHLLTTGHYLQESCSMLQPLSYATPFREKQAHRSVAATLQFIGLDASIKAIGALAQKLSVPEEDYRRLSTNLLKNYCSQNLTVISRKLVEQNLRHYYQHPDPQATPTLEESPFASDLMKRTAATPRALSRQFDLAIRNFRAFCSWGGEVTDYRLLQPYLKNPIIMSFVIKNLAGTRDVFDPVSGSVSPKARPTETVQVLCRDLICRKTSFVDFQTGFPVGNGSTSLSTDLFKAYCHHFRYVEAASSVPEIRQLQRKQELEDPIFETNFFISLLSGYPDPTFGMKNYTELVDVAKSSLDERWGKWANDVIRSFSNDMFYEESLRIRPVPRRDKVALRTEGFRLEFSVTLGELDRVVDDHDKLSSHFDLTLSKNFLRMIRQRWVDMTREINTEGLAALKQDIARRINVQLEEKQKLFKQRMWTSDFSTLLAEELIGQVLRYEGPYFNSYQEETIKVPVTFSYGLFALGYIRYRADVHAGRLKLKI